MPAEPRLPSRRRARLSMLLAVLLLVLLPAALLHESVLGENRFLPFDLSVFPPASCALTPEELALRRGQGNFDITEKSAICTPDYRLAQQELAQGRFPHWNPYVRGGAPLFANALDGFAYPFHLPLLLTDPDRAYGLLAWIDFVLAGIFMLGFLRSIGLQWGPALFGGMVFQLSGTLAANAHFFMRMEALIWLPAGFWALQRLAQRRGAARIPSFVGFATSLGLCWLSGFPPYALAVSMAFGLFILGLCWGQLRQTGLRSALRFAVWAGIATLLGILLAMVQLVPMLDYFPESQRNLDQSLSELVAQGLDPIGLTGLMMPRPFSSPIQAEQIPSMFNPLLYLGWSSSDPETGKLFLPYENFNSTEYALYLGALPLLAALIGLLRASVRFRWFALLGVALFALLATAGPIFELAWRVPVFQSTPPVRYAAVLGFFLSALAAIGFGVGSEGLRRVGLGTAIGIGVGLSAFALLLWLRFSSLAEAPDAAERVAQQISERWTAHYPEVAGDVAKVQTAFAQPSGHPEAPDWARYSALHFSSQLQHLLWMLGAGLLWLLLGSMSWFRSSATRRWFLRAGVFALVALDLLVAARHINPSFPARQTENSEVHKFLRQQREAHRDSGGFMIARVSTQPEDPLQLIPNTLVPEQIRDLNAYAFVDQNSHQPWHELYGDPIRLRGHWMKSFPVDDRIQHPLFDLYGVRYLLSTERFEQLGAPALPPIQGPGGSFYVYERKTALPRAFLVRNARVEQDSERVLGYLTGQELRPRELLLLQDRFGEGIPADQDAKLENPVSAEQLAAASLRFTHSEAGLVSVLVRNSPRRLAPAHRHGHAQLGTPSQWRRRSVVARQPLFPRLLGASWRPRAHLELRREPVPPRSLDQRLQCRSLATLDALVDRHEPTERRFRSRAARPLAGC
jgi:hypothetical protein